MVSASSEPHAEEVRTTILPNMETVELFVQALCQCKSAAAVGAGVLQEADADDDEEDEEHQGLANSAAKAFDVFRETLSFTGKAFADLLSRTHGGGFDEEFRAIASAEVQSAAFSFAWADLFKGNASDTVQGLSLPLLHAACLKWIGSTASQPTGATAKSAIGDADRALSLAKVNGCDHEEEKMRVKTIARLVEELTRQLTLGSVSHSGYTQIGLTKTWKETKEAKAKIEKAKTDAAPPDSEEAVQVVSSRRGAVSLSCVDTRP